MPDALSQSFEVEHKLGIQSYIYACFLCFVERSVALFFSFPSLEHFQLVLEYLAISKQGMASVGKVSSQAMAAGPALGEVDLGTASLLGDVEEPLLDHMGEMYFREQNVFAKCPGFRQFETFELSQGGESNGVASSGGPIEEKDIVAWACQPAASKEGEPFRLKMLIGKMIDYKNKSSCESPGEDVQRSRRILKDAISVLGLSSAVLDSYFKGFANFSPLPASSSPRDLIYCLDIVSGAFTICWRYFPEDNCATALLLYNENDCEQMLGDLKTYLRAQARHIEKPLLLGYIGTVIRFRQTWWQLEQIKEALRKAEQESDYTFLGEQHQPNQIQLDSTAKDGMDLGYIVMVNKQMAGVSINAARRLKQMQDDCQLMVDYEPCPELRNWFRCLVQHIRSRVLFAEASRERATVQIQEVCMTLIAPGL